MLRPGTPASPPKLAGTATARTLPPSLLAAGPITTLRQLTKAAGDEISMLRVAGKMIAREAGAGHGLWRLRLRHR